MFPTKHYVPLLKAKEGEFKALQETANATKDLMTPLFDVVDIPWDYEEGQEAKTIDEHLSKIGKKILDGWGNQRRFFVDSNFIESNRNMEDGVIHHLIYLFNDLRNKGLLSVPTTGTNRSPAYKGAINTIQAQDKRGICLRLLSADLSPATLKNNLDNELAYYNLTPKEVDLLIDFESIYGGNYDLLTTTTVTLINTVLPYLNDWRSLTTGFSSFPSDLSDIDANTIDSIDREEWRVWNNILAAKPNRLPTFGDYSIAHPEILEMDPRNMRVSASIRYTHDTYWLIVRGRWLRRHGYGQYHNLCANLIARAEFAGAAYSWGDNYISDCAANAVGTGNPTTWRKVGNNHHFQKVVHQISNLP